ncbi:LysR substrate-binding domain-containing protein [Paenibacillus andongensis]|uniref:LysR substrate-binding domain-containing protein n=1 Tax=Paenibacillus andongensis TaxID=2975482 RepID=UPI0021BAAB07|nr:LysR substrate-binding domain-containing protein [Paenibacillus andongensis]
MDIRDLTIFATVAKTGSMTRAAEQLDYVQSNITARIQHMENKLGTTLFHRLPRRLTMTSSGEKLLKYAEKILHLYNEAEYAIQDSETPSGSLRIGAMETTTATRLPTILAKYHEAFPDVEFFLSTGPTEQLIDSVLNYHIEAALVAGPVNHPSLEEVAVIQEELVLVSSLNSMNPTMMRDQPTALVFREGCSYRKRLEQYLNHTGLQSKHVIELGTLDGILGCAAAGLGVSLVPRNVVDKGRFQLAVNKIPDEFGKVPTVLVRRKDGYISSALAKFIETVKFNSQSETVDTSMPMELKS